MPLLSAYETPAFLRDMPAGSAFYTQWSNFLSTLIGPTSMGDNGGAFYDARRVAVTTAGRKDLSWMGFPRNTILTSNRDRKTAAYILADSFPLTRERQNEYFEWRVDKTKGKIRKLTFITEMPEYFEQLWLADRAAVVNIYRNLVSPTVNEADLLRPDGSYNPFNQWNTSRGIVHYIQGINNLRAALSLTRSSVRSSPPFRDNLEARPGGFSDTTAVDPRVSFDVHMLIRKGLYLSFSNPIGLYISGWDDSGFTQPDGRPAGNFWRIVRGRPGMVLRLEYEVPAGMGFVVGDMKIGGRPIKYGGQIAEHITVTIGGIAGTLD